MPLIEGIGDEISQFLGLSIGILFAIIAWCSTRISDAPQIRTILVVERRSQNENDQPTSNVDRTDVSQTGRNLCGTAVPQSNESSPVDSDDKDRTTSQSEDFQINSENEGTSERMRLHEQTDNSESPSVGVNPTEKPSEQEAPAENTADNIRIRLKYLNDDQKLVEGRLQELLGDFKKRHFSLELSRQKKIRFIFNGQVLQSDDQTLQGYGLYDNCVVHCLIQTQQTNSRTNTQQNAHTSTPDWNLGALLYACISLVLGFAWFFQYHYSHLFTVTATATLVYLTGMFAVSLIGMYFSAEEVVPS